MAFGIGNLQNIVADFKESLNQIFGQANNTNFKGVNLFEPEYGGATSLIASKWTGNARKPNVVRYGFAILDAKSVSTSSPKESDVLFGSQAFYFLDIPPQALSQKEVFATNISATRKGIIVESEGVVFKDIVIQGTTGVFPGARGAFNGPQANFKNLTEPPKAPAGVDADSGRSTRSQVATFSGYEEFLSLRQFFLKYASDKRKNNGDRFLVFLNEKDNQSLIVEPLEFTMERNSKSPMTYNYRIVMKAIGNLATLFSKDSNTPDLNIFTQIGNVVANISARIGQVRATINATSTGLQKTFQAIDQTVNGPLRQIQFALEDLSNGVSDTLSLPAILARNFTTSIADIRESGSDLLNAVTFKNSADSKAGAASSTLAASTLASINGDSRVPVTRQFVANTRDLLQNHSDELADGFNLGDTLYNQIKGRVVLNSPSPLKVASDEEFLLMGNLQSISGELNDVMANNSAFESDAERTFDEARKVFEDNTLPQALAGIEFSKPRAVRQATIRGNDTLEKIALREMGSASLWPELVILNKLKPPYIDDNGGDHVKKPGDTLLIGVK
jgi:hypothetical protein